MLRAFRSVCWTVFLLLICGTSAHAQSKSQVADSLKKVIADHRQRLFVADSSGDVLLGIELRSQLATLVKPKEARQLLEAAAVLADSANMINEEAFLRSLLGEKYAQVGDHRLAYEQAKRVVVLDQVRLSAQGQSASDRADSLMADATAARDSLEQRWQQVLQGSRHRESHMEATAERWMFITLGIGAVLMLLLIIVLLRMGRQNKRTRSEMDALRTEITTLKEQRPTNQFRVAPLPAVPLPEPTVVSNVPHAQDPSPAAGIDPVVLAMFRKMGPERLATLRDARARGDHAKVTRVVHSLKPQLVNFDDDRFTELCARITAPDASANEVRWSTDLDAFEKGISEVLQRIGH